MRKECEMVVADTFGRCGRNQMNLIRVNPDFSYCDHALLTSNGLVLSITANGLETLAKIDEVLAARSSLAAQ